jgi:hypothetical protein
MDNGPTDDAKVAAAPSRRIEHTRDRTKTVPLAWPVTVDGKIVDSVTVRRLSVREVADYVEQLRNSASPDPIRLPMIVGLSESVIDALDDDDMATIDGVIFDFLPQRLRRLLDGTTQPTGADTPSSSPAE